MNSPSVSVIIVSRGRPGHLSLCLKALALQHYDNFEIVLVADGAGLDRAQGLPVKRIPFNTPNISEARNLGIAHAVGEIIAFIDDDAVAEPTWLERLARPFSDPMVIASTGWTRDRDGFRWESRAARMTSAGFPIPIDLPLDQTVTLAPKDGAPVSTLGTNCAFRAEQLRSIGGFDPIFAYHLDESDVNMRMAQKWPDALTAIVPSAQVVHARAESDNRASNAVPLDLSATGRSAAMFTRRYGGAEPDEEISNQIRRRLIRDMLAGRVDPFRIAGILRSLRIGLSEGRQLELAPPPHLQRSDATSFQRMPTASRQHLVLSGWRWNLRSLRARARKKTQTGEIVTLILLTPTAVPHRLRFTEGGWFEQTGGLWGPSDPDDPPFRPWRRSDRLKREQELAQNRRNSTVLSDVGGPRLSLGRSLA